MAGLRRATALLGVAAAGLALAPVAVAAGAIGAWQRRRLGDPARVRRALRRLGVAAVGPVTVEVLGGGRSNAVLRVGLSGTSYVLKRSLPLGTVLAFAARLVGPQPFAPTVSGAARLRRERSALRRLRTAGVRVPDVIAADPAAGMLLLEDLDGRALPATAAEPGFLDRVEAFGRAIAAAHAAGVVLTDCHPGNALCGADGALALIDLEFAEGRAAVGADFAARRAFDLAYAAAYFDSGEQAAFLSGALAGEAPPAAALAAARARVAPFALLFARERARQRRQR